MRVGVFGGSFDPVHRGHLLLADGSRRSAKLDRIEFIPAAQQPFKPPGPVASDPDRLAMLRLAVADWPEFVVSTIEIERGGVSYTIDTLRELRKQRPDDELFLLLGADALADFPHWREPNAICELSTPLVVRRHGAPAPDFSTLAPFVTVERLAAIRASLVDMPPTPISSSAIRRLIADGGRWRLLVPDKVAAYIDEHGLYRRESLA